MTPTRRGFMAAVVTAGGIGGYLITENRSKKPIGGGGTVRPPGYGSEYGTAYGGE